MIAMLRLLFVLEKDMDYCPVLCSGPRPQVMSEAAAVACKVRCASLSYVKQTRKCKTSLQHATPNIGH
jgi:hypothetical protein